MIGLKDKKEIGLGGAILSVLKEVGYTKKFIIASILFILIYAFLYGFWKIPFINFGFSRMSAVGLFDFLFLLIIAPLSGLFITLYRYERAILFGSGMGIGGAGGSVAGFISAVCPTCQGITLAAFGSTFLNIPTLFLLPYLGLIKIFSIGLMGFAVLLKADSIKNKKCPTIDLGRLLPAKPKSKKLKHENLYLWALSILIVLVLVNQILIPRAFVSFSSGSSIIGIFEYGPKITLKPVPLSAGEQAAIPGYLAKVKSLPTISELVMKPATGDLVQDLMNNIIPTGTPWYGAETGVTFDDPIKSQQLWGRAEGLELDASQENRWNRIVNSFTCDYCCGSPQRPTIITQCGCAHAAGARGMARWFIKNYGDKYSDEEIYGEMARWYALWYPKGTIQRIIQESSVGG